MVLEFMENGDLRQYLQNSSEKNLNYIQLLQIAHDVFFFIDLKRIC